MGLVSLEGMEFYARHGYYEEERAIGNKYSVDITLELDFDEAAKEDKIGGTVNYEKVYELVAEAMGGQATLLLEHLADKMITTIKLAFPRIRKVEVRLAKHNPPVKGICRLARVTVKG